MPSAALGKAFAECKAGFAECGMHSTKNQNPIVSMVINKVREEAKEHPNKITIYIKGKDEEVIQEKKKATTAATYRTAEENVVTNNGCAGGSMEQV